VLLFRYLVKEVMMSMLAVSITLLVIVMSGRFVKYLAQAASGDLAPEMLFSIMYYRLPSFLELVLPLGLFIGILLAYGRLYVESEMTVMNACGMSTRRLSLYTLAPSLFIAAVVGYLSLVVSPHGIGQVQALFAEVKNSSGLETLVAGRFRVDEKTGRVTYVEQLTDERETMQHVFTAQQSKNSKGGLELGVVIAEQGEVQQDDQRNGRYLVLENGYRYVGQPGGVEFKVMQFETFGQLLKEGNRQGYYHQKDDAKLTADLLGSNKLADIATLQWRLSLIVLVPILALIAQALSKTSHRKGRYVKMLPAFLLYIVYLVMLNAARDALEKGTLAPSLGLWWVHASFLLLALLLLFGGSWWRRLKRKPLRAGKA
jgi:lipopolysaccharide export system permease protein